MAITGRWDIERYGWNLPMCKIFIPINILAPWSDNKGFHTWQPLLSPCFLELKSRYATLATYVDYSFQNAAFLYPLVSALLGPSPLDWGAITLKFKGFVGYKFLISIQLLVALDRCEKLWCLKVRMDHAGSHMDVCTMQDICTWAFNIIYLSTQVQNIWIHAQL